MGAAMKKMLVITVVLHVFAMQTLQSMYTRPVRTIRTKTPKKPAPRAPIQRRTITNPREFKHLYEQLTPQAKPFSPIHGAALIETGALEKMWLYGPAEDVVAQLVRALFYKQESQFKPTELKSAAAYALNPDILGLVMGVIASDRLQDPSVRKYIISQWRTEYKTITSGDEISFKKVDELLNLIELAYKENPIMTRSVLLSFLYMKANNKHDLIHYLESVEVYIPVFENDPHFDYEKMLDAKYTINDYEAFEEEISGAPAESALTGSYEKATATIIHQKKYGALYPPKIVRSRYGFKNQIDRPDCVETALRDLWNILLFYPITNSFDVSLLSTTRIPAQALVNFYELQRTADMVNDQKVGQAFMNMVSGLPGISYRQSDYELTASDTANNFLALTNQFFGTDALNLRELGEMLSNQDRKISFIFKEAVRETKKGNPVNCIFTTIKNYKQGYEQKADFYFSDNHAWLETPSRQQEDFLNLKLDARLAQLYDTVQEAQSLFHLQISPKADTVSGTLRSAINPVMYYAFDEKNEATAFKIIQHIIDYNMNNQTAVKYAIHLSQRLSPDYTDDLLDLIITSHAWMKNDYFQNYMLQHALTNNALKIAIKTADEQATQKIIEFLMAHGKDNIQLLYTALKTACNYKKAAIVKLLCNQLPTDFPQEYLSECLLLGLVEGEEESRLSKNLFAITQTLLAHGARPTIHDQKTGTTPLIQAVLTDYSPLIELLLKQRANPNEIIKMKMTHKGVKINGSFTPLDVATLTDSQRAVAALLKFNAKTKKQLSAQPGLITE